MSYESPTPSLVGVLCSFALRNQRKPQTSITYSTRVQEETNMCAPRRSEENRRRKILPIMYVRMHHKVHWTANI